MVGVELDARQRGLDVNPSAVTKSWFCEMNRLSSQFTNPSLSARACSSAAKRPTPAAATRSRLFEVTARR